jgi:hypothetical protein
LDGACTKLSELKIVHERLDEFTGLSTQDVGGIEETLEKYMAKLKEMEPEAAHLKRIREVFDQP